MELQHVKGTVHSHLVLFCFVPYSRSLPHHQAAANHLSRTLAVSLGPRKITVNAIMPGVFPSNMTAFGLAQDKDNKMAGSHPMGRIGAPEDVSACRLTGLAVGGKR